MAGDWLKVEKITPEKPEILAMGARLGMDPELVFAKCFKVWRWADSHTRDGHAARVTLALLDALVSTVGFSQALLEVGWLTDDGNSLSFPNFDRHMGHSGKERSLKAERMRRLRGGAKSATEAPPEKRREEKRR